MSTRSRLAAAALPLLVLTACSAGDDAENPDATGPTEVTAAAGCADVDGELIAADTRAGEPTLEVPLPEGWEDDSTMNSELIRLALINPDLVRDDFAPNIVVTAEPSPADEQAAVDRQVQGIQQATGSADVDREDGEVCGFTSFIADYELPEAGAVPARPARVQVIVVPHGDQTITYTLTAQATAPADPAYAEAVEEIFSGVQIAA